MPQASSVGIGFNIMGDVVLRELTLYFLDPPSDTLCGKQEVEYPQCNVSWFVTFNTKDCTKSEHVPSKPAYKINALFVSKVTHGIKVCVNDEA